MKRNRIIIALLAVVLAFSSILNLGFFGMPSKVEAEGIPSSGKWDCQGKCNYTFSNGILTISPGKDTVFDYGEFTTEQARQVNTVIIEDGVTEIGNRVFIAFQNLRRISIPNTVTKFDREAFCGSGITELTIPASVTSIGKDCFFSCMSLENINVEDGNEYYKSKDGVLYDAAMEELIYFPRKNPMTSFSIPESVVTIDSGAVSNYNEALTEVSIGKNVTTIEDGAFQFGRHVVTIAVDEENENYKAVNGVLYNKEQTKLICWHLDGGFSVPESVTEVADYAFSDSKLTDVTLPEHLTRIGNHAFEHCNLKSVELPGSVNYIGDNAFSNAEVAEIKIPDGVTKLNRYVIAFNTKLKKVELPNSITEIGYGSFAGDTNLVDVFFDGTKMEWEAIRFCDAENDPLKEATIHFNDGTMFNERNYTVKYDGNGGSGGMSSQGFVCGVEKKLLKNGFWNDGATFIGWNTKQDGTGTSYADEESVVNLTTTNGETVVLYAQWKEHKYTVTFDMNGHGTAPADQVLKYGNNITQPATPTAEGYYFSGWYKEAPCVTPWRFSEDRVRQDVTLYAKWTPQPVKEPEVEEPTQDVEPESVEEPATVEEEEPVEEPEEVEELVQEEEPAQEEEQALPENMNDNGDGTYKVEDPDLGETTINAAVVAEGMVYRMYNPNSGEHFYTKDASERENLLKNGWNYEENASFETISATEDGAVPVYRVYNPNSGLHHYTMSKDEALMLKDLGWNYEGISLYVYDANSEFGTPEYRLYNENDGHHHWTVDSNERDALVALGWNDEGIAWRVK